MINSNPRHTQRQSHPRQQQPAVPPRPQRSGSKSTFEQAMGWLKIARWLNLPNWLWLTGIFLLMITTLCAVLTLGLGLIITGGDILPGVTVAGVDVGGKSTAEAAAFLDAQWQQNGITVTDGEQLWTVAPEMLGIQLDPQASAQAAADYNGLDAIFGTADVAPVLNVDLNQAQAGLHELAPQVETPPRNAGVHLVNGHVQATPARNGLLLDVGATLAQIQYDAATLIADGALELVMIPVAPQIKDSSGMVAEAAQLLSNPLNIRGYDPVTDEWLDWTVMPEEWSGWLTATADPSQPSGLALTLDEGQLRAYLDNRNAQLNNGSNRYLDVNVAVQQVREAVQRNIVNPWVRVYHHPGQHMVRPGETITSIAWDYGMPYPWIQAANGGLDTLSVGQTVNLPSPDEFLPLAPVPHKRIEVNLSQQRVRVYEYGQVKWDWPSSTGISDSPTWPGVFQIQSHDGTAYAGNWNLYMPHFMSVYQPVPGIDFFNGFHGFPSRNGSQILWQNSLGTRVTYGCILLSSENASILYDWAEDGVVVEITR